MKTHYTKVRICKRDVLEDFVNSDMMDCLPSRVSQERMLLSKNPDQFDLIESLWTILPSQFPLFHLLPLLFLFLSDFTTQKQFNYHPY